MGYCEDGDVPIIKLFKSSTGEIVELVGDVPYWKNNEIFMLNNLSLDSSFENIPEGIFLKQNYPNPFNPNTTISFTLNGSDNINLSIYDINGKLVKSLLNQNMEQGYHSIAWDGTNNNNMSVSSGTYFCKLISSTNQKQIKLLLIK